MTASRKRFTQEFKDELCHEVINASKPIKDVATAYGVVNIGFCGLHLWCG